MSRFLLIAGLVLGILAVMVTAKFIGPRRITAELPPPISATKVLTCVPGQTEKNAAGDACVAIKTTPAPAPTTPPPVIGTTAPTPTTTVIQTPSCILKADPETIEVGQEAFVRLISQNATSGTINGTAVGAIGNLPVKPATSATFLAKVSGPGGNFECSTGIKVVPAGSLKSSLPAFTNTQQGSVPPVVLWLGILLVLALLLLIPTMWVRVPVGILLAIVLFVILFGFSPQYINWSDVGPWFTANLPTTFSTTLGALPTILLATLLLGAIVVASITWWTPGRVISGVFAAFLALLLLSLFVPALISADDFAKWWDVQPKFPWTSIHPGWVLVALTILAGVAVAFVPKIWKLVPIAILLFLLLAGWQQMAAAVFGPWGTPPWSTASASVRSQCDNTPRTISVGSNYQPITIGCQIEWDIDPDSPCDCLILYGQNGLPLRDPYCKGDGGKYNGIPIRGWRSSANLTLVTVTNR